MTAAEDKYLIDSSVKGSSMSEQSMSGAERHRQGISQAIHLAVPTVMVTHMVDGRSPAVVSGMTCQLYLHPCVDLDPVATARWTAKLSCITRDNELGLA